MSDFQDFLNTLTADQLRQLADLKEQQSDDKPNKKRKQKRKKLVLPEEEHQATKELRPSKPVRKSKSKRRSKQDTVDKLLRSKGVPAKRLGATELGKRPNRFVDGDLQEYSETEMEDIKTDKLLNKDRKPSKRLKPERQRQFVEAECSKCEDLFENVPVHACYKDGGNFVFICDDCVGSLRN